MVEVVLVVLPQLHHARQKVVARKITLDSRLVRQARRAYFNAFDEVKDGVLVALSEGGIVLATPDGYEGLPGGVSVRHCQAAFSLITTLTSLGEVQDKVCGCLEICRVFETFVFGGKEVPLSQGGVVGLAGAREVEGEEGVSRAARALYASGYSPTRI